VKIRLQFFSPIQVHETPPLTVRGPQDKNGRFSAKNKNTQNFSSLFRAHLVGVPIKQMVIVIGTPRRCAYYHILLFSVHLDGVSTRIVAFD